MDFNQFDSDQVQWNVLTQICRRGSYRASVGKFLVIDLQRYYSDARFGNNLLISKLFPNLASMKMRTLEVGMKNRHFDQIFSRSPSARLPVNSSFPVPPSPCYDLVMRRQKVRKSSVIDKTAKFKNLCQI